MVYPYILIYLLIYSLGFDWVRSSLVVAFRTDFIGNGKVNILMWCVRREK